MTELGEKLKAKGKKPYLIPGGNADPLGALGYVACAEEIILELQKKEYGITHVVCASGSGGTQAGLLAGFAATSTPLEVIGINVRRSTRSEQETIISKLTLDTLHLLGAAHLYKQEKIFCVERFLGPGYSIPDVTTLEAIKLLARSEAILADPVYTGKSLAGLIGLAREGYFQKGAKILFLHTGGSPALFSYTDSFPEVYPFRDERY
jgi:D-cysteine desulfhydrase